jgi:predicted DNA-binding transcriptional regulator YafY
MARNEQLIRQHKILQLLERYRFGRTLDEIRDDLVNELGLGSLHSRSVRRDLEALQAAGIDVDVHDSQRGKVWKLGPGVKSVHKITASATELMALSLGRDLLHPLAGTPFWQGIETFWNKVKDELPASVYSHYEKYRQLLFVIGTPAKSYADQHGSLSTLNRCMLEHRVVEVEYQAPGKTPQTRKIEPYAIVFYQSSLYIVAAAHEIPANKDRMRHFKLDRFRKTTALDEWFKPDPEFRADQYLAGSIGIFSKGKPLEVKIRVSPQAASWVLEDPWRPDQEVERQPDGGIILKVKAAHELEIIPRVLALGAEAEILSPASCRKLMAETVQKMTERYST